MGAPYPIIVLQSIKTGLSEIIAPFKAASIDSKWWPSQTKTFHPFASKRFFISVEEVILVFPSIVIELSSQRTIKFFKFQWPAKEIASSEIPSIKHPSPTKT